MATVETKKFYREWHPFDRGCVGLKIYDESKDAYGVVTLRDAVAHASLGFEPRTFRDCLEEKIIVRDDVKLMMLTGRESFETEEDLLNAVVTIESLREMNERGTWFPFRIVLLRPHIEYDFGVINIAQYGTPYYGKSVTYSSYVRGGDLTWYDPAKDRGSLVAIVTARKLPEGKLLELNDDGVLGKEYAAKRKAGEVAYRGWSMNVVNSA